MILCFFACADESSRAIVSEGISHQSPSCIDRIIALDDSLGSLRNHSCERISLDQTIANYIDGLTALDFSGCPEEFTSAFNGHIQAWRDMQPVTAQYADLRGEMHDLFDELSLSPDSTLFNSRLNQIWSTWAEIEATMEK